MKKEEKDDGTPKKRQTTHVQGYGAKAKTR
jgi:hypothetical protein